MAANMDALVRQGWHTIRSGAKWVVRLPSQSMLSAATWLGRGTLDLMFPGTCVSCHAELNKDDEGVSELPFCRMCLEQLELLSGPTCRRCGGPVPNLGKVITDGQSARLKEGGCFRCQGRKLWFDETIAAGIYAGLLRELLLRMKRTEGNSLSLAMGELVWQTGRERLKALEPDVIVPIPLHWRRRVAHLTNSAAMLAEVLASRLCVPLAERLLRRRRHTAPQHTLTPPQRWHNVRQAFSVRSGYHLNEAHVLLVDDILTTGATCSEAANALRKAGAARVTVVVAARAIS